MKRFWDFVWLLSIVLILTALALLYIGKSDMKNLREITKKDLRYILTGQYR